MTLVALVLLPVAGAIAAYFVRPASRSRWLVGGAIVHLGLTTWVWMAPPAPTTGGWFVFDALGGLVLALISVVFAAVAVAATGSLRHEDPRGGRAFVSALLIFLASASAIALTHHFGVLWVAMEATTLATAPLIYDPRDRHSLEAVWKYLLVCSVGIALALLGTFFLASAQLAAGSHGGRALVLEDLMARAPFMSPAWLRAAFVLLLIGYGTKMGLAPMHAWLPDAHGEAPSPISALLSGALLNLAFLAILRSLQVVHASGDAAFARTLLIGFGLLSIVVSAAFLLAQQNYKRMLAYSSVEQMGLLAVGAGLAGVSAWGALLVMVCGSLAKAALFLSAGHILLRYSTKRTAEVTGVIAALPATAALFVAGFFAISASPPFGTFLGEIALVSGAVGSGRLWLALVVLGLQVVIFAAMGRSVFHMVFGAPGPTTAVVAGGESRWLVLPPLALLLLSAWLGVVVPGPVRAALDAAASAIGGVRP